MPKVEIEDTELAELRKLAGTATKQSALAEALQGELKTAKDAAARVPGLEAELGQHKAAQLDTTFAGAGITDAKVRKVFQIEFDEQAATGEKDLGKWLGGLQGMKPEERPAHLAPFIKAPVAGGAGGNAAGQRGPGGLPDANKGAAGVPNQGGAYTAESIAKMNDAEFKAAFPAISKQFPELAPLGQFVTPVATA